MIPLRIIDAQVTTYFDLKPDEMFTSTRKRHIVEARHIFYYFARKYNNAMSLSHVGKYKLKRDHATVINGYKQVQNFIETDANFKKDIEKLTIILNDFVEDEYSLSKIKENIIDRLYKCRNVYEIKDSVPEFILQING